MSGYRDAMIKNIRSKQAVSEVIGVVLLLGITVSLFALLNYTVFHFSFDPSVTSVNLIGTIDKTNSVVEIEHRGGEPLRGDVTVIVTIASQAYRNNVSDLLLDKNVDGQWTFSETVMFHSPVSLINKYVRIDVVDPVKNAVLLSVVLQQESS